MNKKQLIVAWAIGILLLNGCASTKVNYGSLVSTNLSPKDANAEMIFPRKSGHNEELVLA